MRKGLWERVSVRKHYPLKIFPAGNNSDEVMLYGTVDYGLKAGGEAGLDWAARAHLVKEDGRVKMDYYQVYLVSFLLSPQAVLKSAQGLKANQMMQDTGAQQQKK